MAKYERQFGEKLAEIAGQVAADDPVNFYAGRAVIYLSLLSTEITLKALLEQAGKPVREIKARSHDLRSLLEDLGKCKVQIKIGDELTYDRASRLRAVPVDPAYQDATVGKIIETTPPDVSKYPGEIRYGEALRHYPPRLLAGMALAISAWADEYWDTIHIHVPEGCAPHHS